MKGIITDIQHFSVHDGPGIRTTVFLKGCNLRCFWCHNPETLAPFPELQFFPEKCIYCGECIKVCTNNAHESINNNKVFNRERCKGCGACSKGCYSGALKLVGKRIEAEEVLEEVLLDSEFYKTSRGGVTISGGEPLFQSDFTYDILRLCKENKISTAIESNMCWPWEVIKPVLTVTDLIMMDIKLFNDEMHKKVTGMSNKLILQNAVKLSKEGTPVIIRTPVIPDVNDNEKEIKSILDFIKDFTNMLYYELLPYHPLGTSKYKSLGMDYTTQKLTPPDNAKMNQLKKVAKNSGIRVR